ncbi:MAG: DUF1134 domain-containing protein [Hyphomicrobiaceae bacterium]|nr:DUF1134 domain-containing protein [Hyphomicrobiaceae bacterium]MCC0024210.1 DUF1134 domain-containing protein [Hyphomicrobiaceae bacterium]
MTQTFARLSAIIGLVLALCLAPVAAQAQGSVSDTYSSDELVTTGHQFFGAVSEGLASLVERAVGQFGQPNAYILGQEGSGALLLGGRYGEGTMFTRNVGEHDIFWQGPSVGFDIGGDGSRVMMLVYNLPSVEAMYNRYPGVAGTAFVVGGFGMTVLKRGNVVVVPIRAGVGARLGVSVGYLKFTYEPTWNPF